MEISPEERRRIYEEEKARIEGASTSTDLVPPQEAVSQPTTPEESVALGDKVVLMSESPGIRESIAYLTGLFWARLSRRRLRLTALSIPAQNKGRARSVGEWWEHLSGLGRLGFITVTVSILFMLASSLAESNRVAPPRPAASLPESPKTQIQTKPLLSASNPEVTMTASERLARAKFLMEGSNPETEAAKYNLEEIPKSAKEYTEAKRMLARLQKVNADNRGGKQQLSPNEAKISRQEFGTDWPFTVDEGLLTCKGSGGVGEVVFTAKGASYAVNGVAKGTKRYRPIEDVWAENPSLPGTKKNIGPIIERGLRLCR